MSNPVIKGEKRASSRPTAQNVSSGAAAKGRKLIASSAARSEPKRSAAEKAPVRKATPTKQASSRTTNKSAAQPAKATAKQAAPAKKAASKTRAAAPAPVKSTKTTAARPATKQPVKTSPAKKGAPTTRPAAHTSRTTATPPARHAPTKQAHHAPTPPRQPSRDEAAALRAFERARKEFARGRFGEARSLFRALIEQHAGVAEVTARARTYLAITEARLRSEASQPRDAEALYNRGVIELNRGDYVAAQEMFERALKQDEQAADVHYALAAARARLGAIASALQSLERALGLKPSLRVRALHDIDLVALRSEPDFERLMEHVSRP